MRLFKHSPFAWNALAASAIFNLNTAMVGQRLRCLRCVQGLLTRVRDTNKHVQEAACSALATLEEAAGRELLESSRITAILKTLAAALQVSHICSYFLVTASTGTTLTCHLLLRCLNCPFLLQDQNNHTMCLLCSTQQAFRIVLFADVWKEEP